MTWTRMKREKGLEIMGVLSRRGSVMSERALGMLCPISREVASPYGEDDCRRTNHSFDEAAFHRLSSQGR